MKSLLDIHFKGFGPGSDPKEKLESTWKKNHNFLHITLNGCLLDRIYWTVCTWLCRLDATEHIPHFGYMNIISKSVNDYNQIIHSIFTFSSLAVIRRPRVLEKRLSFFFAALSMDYYIRLSVRMSIRFPFESKGSRKKVFFSGPATKAFPPPPPRA